MSEAPQPLTAGRNKNYKHKATRNFSRRHSRGKKLEKFLLTELAEDFYLSGRKNVTGLIWTLENQQIQSHGRNVCVGSRVASQTSGAAFLQGSVTILSQTTKLSEPATLFTDGRELAVATVSQY